MWRDIRTGLQLRRRFAILGGIVAAGLALTGCGADASRAPEYEPSTTSPPSATARVGEVDFDGMTVAYSCTGDGSPAVILEAGDPRGTDAWPAAFIAPIAEVTMVCTYDRLGAGGGSSEPPDRPRTWDDIASVIDGVLGALELEPPFVVAGQSGGGNIAIAYAVAHPDRVAALVSIEAYHDDPAEMAAWQAEEGFTWADNPEHFDVVAASAQQDAYPMPAGEFPVLIISATQADPGGVENQAYWLGLSPNSRQVVIEGPHDLQEAAPQEVAAEIVDLLAGLPVVE